MDIYRENVKVPEVESATDSVINSYPQASRVIHRVIHRLGQGVGVAFLRKKWHPRVLSAARICIILPNKKYTLK
jgi:hypothetical protein